MNFSGSIIDEIVFLCEFGKKSLQPLGDTFECICCVVRVKVACGND